MPRLFVETDDIVSTGKVITVPSGGDLQVALNQAQPGDVISLQAGAVYMGPFTLPYKQGSGWITLESSAVASALPKPGTRVSPADAADMPKLEALSGSVISTASGAHNYLFIGIEITPGTPTPSVVSRMAHWLRSALPGAAIVRPTAQATVSQAAQLVDLVTLGSGDTSTSTLPSYIVFDRCYIHGDAVVGARRGIAMNSMYTAVINSYLSDFKQTDVDSQAIGSWNGPGPFKIQNDYLEAAGENVMFGGQDPSIQGLVPSDIEVLGNLFSKPIAWMQGNPAYQGTAWSIKNIFELKNASRVLVQGNLFEYNWAASQDGFSILFTVRDQDGTAPWSVVQDVTFTDNVVQHVANGINILGYDNIYPSQQTARVLVSNNLFDDVGGAWGPGVLLAMNDGTRDVHVIHNTSLQTSSIVFSDGRPHSGFVYSDNIAPHNAYGIIGTNTGVGNGTLEVYFPGIVMRNNVLIGAPASAYPAGNYFPATLADVDFADAGAQDYRLAPGSSFRSAADDGKDIGVDVDELCAALNTYGQGLVSTVPSCQTVP